MELRQSDLNFVCSRIPQDVRRFMVADLAMKRAVLTIGYQRFILDLDSALAVVPLLSGGKSVEVLFGDDNRDYALTGEKVEVSLEVVNDSQIKPVDIAKGKEEGGES